MTPPPGWFRHLLALLPADFRRVHGEEICELAGQYAEGRSALGRTLVWFRAAVDLIPIAVRMRGLSPGQLGREIRYGIRSLRRDVGFTLFAVVILGTGIGASVTVFSVARALLFRPLPFSEPERLVWISNGEFGRGQRLSSISVQSGQLEPLRNASSQFSDVGGYSLFDREGDHTLQLHDEPLRATRLRVTSNFFDVLGIEPTAGRHFAEDEVWDDGPAVLLLTYQGWQRFFSGNGNAVGASVVLDGAPATIIGILPPSFDYRQIFGPGSHVDYVVPFPLTERSNRTGNTLGLIGRLAPGATIASAQAEAEALVRSDLSNRFRPVVRPLREHLSGGFRPAMVLLATSVLLVMLMVCANISNLLLARGAAREQEVAIRSAIGAGRSRLVFQFLTESLILSGGGALLGAILAVGGTRFLASLDLRIPMLGHTRVDGMALLLSLGAALAVGLLFGVAPALRAGKVDPSESLKEGGRASSGSRRHSTLRKLLVVVQVAIACLLLVTSTLTARSLMNLVRTDLGYDPSGTIALRVDPSRRFARDEERVAFFSDVLDRTRTSPGVLAAGLTDVLPMAFNRTWSFRIAGATGEERTFPYVRVVSEGYVDAMGLEVLEGRDLAADDGPNARRVCLINEVLARWISGDESPIGAVGVASGREYEVVGVVRSTRQLSVDQEPGPELFLPIRQLADHGQVQLIVRGSRPIRDLTAAVRQAVRGAAPDLPLDGVQSLEAIVGGSLAPSRFLTWLLSGFAAFALVLAGLGVYSVIAYAVTQRHRVIGIHIALGATNGLVVRQLVGESLRMTAVGLGFGLVISPFLARALRSLLFGVEATDPATFVGAGAVLVLVAGVASWIPARRALAIDPVDVAGRVNRLHP